MFDEFLKHAHVLNILDQKCSFNSVMCLVDVLKNVSFTHAQLTDMEEEFTILQSIDISDFPKKDLMKQLPVLMMMETLKFTGLMCRGTIFST